MATSVMFASENVMDNDPLMWSEECALGSCDNNLAVNLNVPADKMETLVTYSQWTYGWKEVKLKDGESKKKCQGEKDIVMEGASKALVAEDKVPQKPATTEMSRNQRREAERRRSSPTMVD